MLALEQITCNNEVGKASMRMPEWSKERTAQHAAAYPADDRRERNRLAQRRYRERHKRKRAHIRTITNILTRQAQHHGELKRFVDALRALMQDEWLKALQKELRRPRPKPTQ
jgi:hypothetical protein